VSGPTPGQRPPAPTEANIRRWLTWLAQPNTPPDAALTDLLRRHGELPAGGTETQSNRAVATALRQVIERFRAGPDAPWREQLPYRVLQTCYLAGLKHFQAASELALSPRQLSRERTRAVRLVQAALADALAEAGPSATTLPPADEPPPSVTPTPNAPSYQFTPIPAILDFQNRAATISQLGRLVTRDRFVHVHGPRGIGKTCLVAELALDRRAATPVLWYRFRAGVNDTPASLLFELAEHLRSRGRPSPAEKFDTPTPPEPAILGRLILRELTDLPLLLVLDDFHVVEHDPTIAGFLDDAVSRLQQLHVIVIGRHADPPDASATSFEIPPMTRLETQKLLTQAGLRPNPSMAHAIQRWTAGIPQLIRLAATWLQAANDDEIARGLTAFTELDTVQAFLLGSITELVASADRTVLDAASLFRQHFSDEAVAHVAGLTVGTVRDTSRRFVTAHLATRSRNGDVAFFHASVREYFYNRLDEPRRSQLHQRAANWFETHGFPDEARHHRTAAARSTKPAPR
jgi:ATP/maltotriose-dependent transcriptional regulator MalT